MTIEINNGSTNAQMIEVQGMLEKSFPVLSLTLAFLVHLGKPIFDLIHNVQVAMAPSWANRDGAVRPQMHGVFNQLLKLHADLWEKSSHGTFVDECVQALNEKQHESYRGGFTIALTTAANTVQAYLGLLPFAKSARVFGHRRRLVLSSKEGMGQRVDG